MMIAVEQVVTDMPAVKAYKVVMTDNNGVPAAPPAELEGIGRAIFEQLEREGK
jgi:hypothetical protein